MQQARLFLRYVDDIVRTVKGDPEKVLRAAKSATGCAPLQYKISVIEGTVHRVFRSTSTWEEYDKAMKVNCEQWLDNQYPESWSSLVASHALEKIIREGKKHG